MEESPFNLVARHVTSFVFANIQGLQLHQADIIPCMSGLLVVVNTLFVAPLKLMRDYIDSEGWILNYNLLGSDRTGVGVTDGTVKICT